MRYSGAVRTPLGLTALLACGLACTQGSVEVGGEGSDGTARNGGGPAQGSTARLADKPATTTPERPGPVAVTLAAPVPVVDIAFEASGPCERQCGQVGECIGLDAEVSSRDATLLELQCLGMCEKAPDSDPARERFLACGDGQSQAGQAANPETCPELIACADREWAALAESAAMPELGAVIDGAITCTQACSWIYHCMAFNTPPNTGDLDPMQLEVVNSGCVDLCETISGEDEELENLERAYHCLQSKCTSDAFECLE